MIEYEDDATVKEADTIEDLAARLGDLNDEIMQLINKRNDLRENLEERRQAMNSRIESINASQYEFEYKQVNSMKADACEEAPRARF